MISTTPDINSTSMYINPQTIFLAVQHMESLPRNIYEFTYITNMGEQRNHAYLFIYFGGDGLVVPSWLALCWKLPYNSVSYLL
jgi:hypothetical protein